MVEVSGAARRLRAASGVARVERRRGRPRGAVRVPDAHDRQRPAQHPRPAPVPLDIRPPAAVPRGARIHVAQRRPAPVRGAGDHARRALVGGRLGRPAGDGAERAVLARRRRRGADGGTGRGRAGGGGGERADAVLRLARERHRPQRPALDSASLMLVPFALVFAGAGALLASWNPRATVGLLGAFAFASYLDTELGPVFK